MEMWLVYSREWNPELSLEEAFITVYPTKQEAVDAFIVKLPEIMQACEVEFDTVEEFKQLCDDAVDNGVFDAYEHTNGSYTDYITYQRISYGEENTF